MSLCALAQQSAKQTKIGWLSPFGSFPIPAAAKNLQDFRQSLEHLGHVEDRDIVIEFRSSNFAMQKATSADCLACLDHFWLLDWP
jgi:hypothetical protein